MNWPIIFLLSLTGLFMGLITSLVGLPPSLEPGVWMGFYVVWVTVVTVRDVEKPFLTIMAASVLCALWTGFAQMFLWDSYMANNPAYAEQMVDSKPWQAVPFALMMGLGFGLVVGGIAVGVRKIRKR